MKKILLTSMACLLFATAASAAEDKARVYLGLDLYTPDMRIQGDTFSPFTTGFLPNVLIGVKYNNLRAEIDFLMADYTRANGTGGSEYNFAVGATVLYEFASNRGITPFAGGGVSLGMHSTDLAAGEFAPGSAAGIYKYQTFGFNVQGGVSFEVLRDLNLDLYLKLGYDYVNLSKFNDIKVKDGGDGYVIAMNPGLKLRYTF